MYFEYNIAAASSSVVKHTAVDVAHTATLSIQGPVRLITSTILFTSASSTISLLQETTTVSPSLTTETGSINDSILIGLVVAIIIAVIGKFAEVPRSQMLLYSFFISHFDSLCTNDFDVKEEKCGYILTK